MSQIPSISYSEGSVMDVAIWIDAPMLSREAAFMRHLIMGLKSDGQKVTFIVPQGLDISTLPLVLGSRASSPTAGTPGTASPSCKNSASTPSPVNSMKPRPISFSSGAAPTTLRSNFSP